MMHPESSTFVKSGLPASNAASGSGVRAEPPDCLPAKPEEPTFISSRVPVTVTTQPTEPSVPTSNVQVGDTLDHFELKEFIGGGGMGCVYRAEDKLLNRDVAIKVLLPSQAADPDTVARFRNEARSAARLDHENIARVFYVGTDRGVHYIAFEFVNGPNLKQLVQQNEPLSLADTLRITLQIADALAHASSRGVVHRDIKPSNVLLNPEGRVKLVDMGLARLRRMDSVSGDLTASGVTLGTFDYISPEQARDPRNADVRSDIYSLGCTVFFMLTGRPPFPEGTVLQKLLQHQGDTPPDPRESNPRVPEELSRILRRMLAKDPRHRYQTAQELIGELCVLCDQRGIQPEVRWAPPVAPYTMPKPWLRALPVVVPCLLLVLAVAAVKWAEPLPSDPPLAVTTVLPQDTQAARSTTSEPNPANRPPRIADRENRSPAPNRTGSQRADDERVPIDSGNAGTSPTQAAPEETPGRGPTTADADGNPVQGQPRQDAHSGGPTQASESGNTAPPTGQPKNGTNGGSAGSNSPSGSPAVPDTSGQLPSSAFPLEGSASGTGSVPSTSTRDQTDFPPDGQSTVSPGDPFGSNSPAGNAPGSGLAGPRPMPAGVDPGDGGNASAAGSNSADRNGQPQGSTPRPQDSATPGASTTGNATSALSANPSGTAGGSTAAELNASGGTNSQGTAGSGSAANGSATTGNSGSAPDTGPGAALLPGNAAGGGPLVTPLAVNLSRDPLVSYDSLPAAIRDAHPGEVLELRFSGRKRMKPFTLQNKRLTLRAGTGYQPVFVFEPQAEDLKQAGLVSMISVTGEQLTLLGIALELTVHAEASSLERLSLFGLQQTRLLRLEDCWITVRNVSADGRAFHPDVAVFEVSPPLGTRMEIMDPSTSQTTLPKSISIELADCVIRGEANMLRSVSGQPLDLSWNNGLLATSERFLSARASTGPAPGRIHCNLRHVTLSAGRGLILAESRTQGSSYPTVEVETSDCLVLAEESLAPMIEQVGYAEVPAMQSKVVWSGNSNSYEGLNTFWQIHNLAMQQDPARLGWLEWSNHWKNTERAAQLDIFSWSQLESQRKPYCERIVSDYIPRSAGITATAGFDSQLLPPLPPAQMLE